MSNALAKKTIRRITNALDEGQTGSMGEIVQTVRKLSGRIAEVSIPDLSEIIGRDPSITEKVISASNSFGYNPSGIEIGTINQAIITVGFDRIRNLTMSLMMAEGAGKARNNDQQREMAALSVCSGMLAQNILSKSAETAADPELAFVSASLRNYGKLLMSTFFVDEYIEARDLASDKSPDEAYFEVFGITPLNLGHTLLEGTNLPDLVMKSLEKVPKETLTRSAQTEDEEILTAAEFCVKVCELSFNEGIDPDTFENELNKLTQKYGSTISIDPDTVIEALEKVDETMSELNQIIGIKDEASPANLKLRARINGNPVPKINTQRKKSKTRSVSINGKKVELETPNDLDGLLSLLTAKRIPGEAIDLSKIYSIINSVMMDSLKLESCMTFIPDEERSRETRFSAQYGIGPLYDRIKTRPLISPDNKDLFSICLNRKEDILIQDTKAGKIASVIPEWIHTRGDVTSMIVLPTVCDKDLFALFIGTKTDGEQVHVDKKILGQLRQFRNELSEIATHNKSIPGAN